MIRGVAGSYRGIRSVNYMQTKNNLADLQVQFLKDRLDAKGVKPLQYISVLDCNCEEGILALRLARLGADVTGIDSDFSLINRAFASVPANLSPKPHFEVNHLKSITTLFDVVCAFDSFELIPDLAKYFRELALRTRVNGSVFLTTVGFSIQAYAHGLLSQKQAVSNKRVFPRQ